MSSPEQPFAGRVVLVTGGARGLGREISRVFADRGAHVVINYFHATDEARTFLDVLTAAGRSAELVRASVAVRSQVDAMFDTVADRHGQLDVLVNNAASGALLPLSELDDLHWQRAFDTNLRGALWCARRAAELMAGGAIVNLSSIGSELVLGNYASVGTTKAAVEALTRYLAVEFAPRGIRVNTASGGLLDSAVAGMFPDADRLAERVRFATPLGNRLGREAELAELVAFLASPQASWITGQTVLADGGLSLGSVSLSPGRTESLAPAEPDQAEPDPAEAIAIVGMGVVTPGANDPDQLWQVLSGQRNVFGEPGRYDIDSFYSPDQDAEDRTYTRKSGFITAFEPHPALRTELDGPTPPSRESTALWLRHCLHSALGGVSRRAGDRYFAAFGYTADGSQDLEEHLVMSGFSRRLGRDPGGLLAARYDRLGVEPARFLPHRVGREAIAGLLPERTELVMVDTACSSSLYAIDLGVKALREGSCDVAVCGGAFAYSARNLVLFSKLTGLSRTGEVRAFDQGASGVLFSDGAGVVLLKRLGRARADGDRVLGVLDGIGLSCDGKGKAIYAPSRSGQVLALRRAYERGGVAPASVRWVVAHATGTRAGDSTEIASLNEVVGQGPAALLSSNKAMIGHTGWAAGVVSVIQALVGLNRREVPPQRYLTDPLPALDASRFTAPTATTRLRPGRVAVSSFGFGGTNAHLVLGAEPSGGTAPVRIANEDVVVVGWSVDVPGSVEVTDWLRGVGDAPDLGFGDEYPLPSVTEVQLPPATMRNMDRAQVMLLRTAARLKEPVRAACARLRDTTGVIAGHMGPTRRAVHYALRCYLGDLETAPAGEDSALPALAGAVRAIVPPSTEDAFPGIMPNIVAARLASLWDFHGLNETVDTGPDSSSDALRCAERYLRHGDLDLALVAGVNGNSTAELADVLASGGERDRLAEGAFLVVLARRSTADAEGLPVLARIGTTLAATDPATRPRRCRPIAGSRRTYLGADGMVALLGALARGSGSHRIGSVLDWGTQVDVVVRSTPDTHDRAAVVQSAVASTNGSAAETRTVARASVARTAVRIEPAAPRAVRAQIPAMPPKTVLLVQDSTLARGLRQLPGVVPVVMPENGAADRETLERLLPAEADHVRLLAAVGAGSGPPDDLSAVNRLRGLHDLAYLMAQRWAGRGGSFGVVLLDALREDTPHPACGPFTGLVKALAREEPDALSLAVLTDSDDPEQGLRLWSVESGRDHEFAVVLRSGDRRLAYTLAGTDLDTTPAGQLEPLRPGAVVVAAGGARGLTAELLRALADRRPHTVYLLSRTAPGAMDIPGRAAFLTERRVARPDRAVADIVAEHDRLRAAAETARLVRWLDAHLGSGSAHHLVCDLTKQAAVDRAVDRILAAHGTVDLLINAAGLHRGGRVRATPLEQARAVRDTKLLGYLNLRRAFADRRPRRWLNFGSLLAVLGWPGEADYCSGNDLLNLAAAWQAEFGAGDESTIAWPLWDQAGFASEPVTRGLLRSQDTLTGLSNEEGRELFLAELTAPSDNRVVTFIGDRERGWLRRWRHGPFVSGHTGKPAAPYWRPDLGVDGYLRHHLLHGVPTLPGAFVIELAADAAGGKPAAFRDLRFLAPIAVPPRRPPDYRVVAASTGHDVAVRVLSDVRVDGGPVLRRDRVHAELTVVSTAEPRPPRQDPPAPAGDPLPHAYHDGGPVALSGPFRSLDGVTAGTDETVARFAPELGPWAERFAAFRLPVLLVDAMVQLELAAGPSGDHAAVPVGVASVEVFTRHNDVELLNRYGPGIVLCADAGGVHAIAPDGSVLVRLRGMRVETPSTPVAVPVAVPT